MERRKIKRKDELDSENPFPESKIELPLDEEEEATPKTTAPKRRVRPPPAFEYPALPVWETILYFLVVFSAVIYAWYLVYHASRKYRWRGGLGTRRKVIWPILGKVKRDTTNYEWEQFLPILLKFVPALCGHSICFNISHYLFGSRKNIAEALTFFYGIAVCIWIFEPRVVGVSVCHGLIVFACAKAATYLKTILSPGIRRFAPLRLIIWLPPAVCLYVNLEYTEYFCSGTEVFPCFLLLGYKLLQYIGFGLEMYSGENYPIHSNLASELWAMFRFAFYLPYLYAVIVLYPDFNRQMNERETRPREWKATLFFVVRIFFWYWFIELILLNYFHFEAILAHTDHLRTINLTTLTSLGWLTGPICISRVVLYSKMWRSFDRGLYNFFIKYIFIPICEPSFSASRKLMGILLTYMFVLLWHGFNHQCFVWIGLSVTELFLEEIPKAVYSMKPIKEFRERNLSDRNFRRILAWLQIIPFAFALFSTFYFLTGAEAGYVFVERVFWGETYTLQYPFFLLITLGYFYCNVCIDCERWFGTKEEKLKAA